MLLVNQSNNVFRPEIEIGKQDALYQMAVFEIFPDGLFQLGIFTSIPLYDIIEAVVKVNYGIVIYTLVRIIHDFLLGAYGEGHSIFKHNMLRYDIGYRVELMRAADIRTFAGMILQGVEAGGLADIMEKG
ncbi:MAG: hypothetical protein KAI75_09045, partial [Desulfobulbaceae bacterium]|nr:hypothetical protein [Desulfobulbaceae bacterium]